MGRGTMDFIPFVMNITMNGIPFSNLYTSPRNILVYQCCWHTHNNCSPCTAQEPAIAILPSVPIPPCNFCTKKTKRKGQGSASGPMKTAHANSNMGLRSGLLTQFLWVDSKASRHHNPNTKGNQEKGASSGVTPRVLSQFKAQHDVSLHKTYCIPPSMVRWLPLITHLTNNSITHYNYPCTQKDILSGLGFSLNVCIQNQLFLYTCDSCSQVHIMSDLLWH